MFEMNIIDDFTSYKPQKGKGMLAEWRLERRSLVWVKREVRQKLENIFITKVMMKNDLYV